MGVKSAISTSIEKIVRGEKNAVLKATIDVVPNPAFRAKGIYQCEGLGIYSGMYYANKVTHTINASGYSVIIEATKKDLPGEGVGGGAIGSGDTESAPPEESARPSRDEVHITNVSTITGDEYE